jgi:hypothetical protein
VSRRAALRLLEKVLDNDDVELAGELIRFLGPVPRAETPEMSSNRKCNDGDGDGDGNGKAATLPDGSGKEEESPPPTATPNRHPHHHYYNSETSPLIDIGITPDDEEYCILISFSLLFLLFLSLYLE